MRTLSRFFQAVVLTLLAAFSVGAAVLLGRQGRAPLAAADLFSLTPNRLVYEVIDIGRGLTSRHTMFISGGANADFESAPPLILQRIRRGEFVDWTFSELDVFSEALTPVMKLSTPALPGLEMTDVQRHGEDVSVFNGWSGGIYRSGSTGTEGQLIALTDRGFRGAVWSHGWDKLVVSTLSKITIMDADGGSPITLTSSDSPLMQPKWSADNRYILFSASSSIVNSPISVMDVDSGEIVAQTDGRAPVWCAGQIVYTVDSGGGQMQTHLADPVAGTDELIVTLDLSESRASERSLTAQPFSRESCEWFVVGTTTGESWLLRRETKTLIPLGDEVRVLEIGGGAVTYQAEAGQTTEIRRIALTPDVQRYESLMRLASRELSVKWLDGAHGVLFIDGRGGLTFADADTGAETALIQTSVRAYFVME